MNICLVTNEFPSLTETFITTKALELRKKGHQVTVIKNQDNKVFNASHMALVKESGIEIFSAIQINSIADIFKVALKYPSVFVSSFSFSKKTFGKNVQQRLKTLLLNKHKFDVIHVEFSGLAVAYQKALEETKAKTLVSCRGTAEKVKPLSEPHRKAELNKLFNTIDAIHCVSADMARTIAPLGADKNKVFINRPSVDAGVFKRTKPYSLQNKRLEILTIGRFTFQKGYIVGLIAAAKLVKNGIHFQWTIVGDGPLKEEMLFHIHTLGLNEVVTLAGKKNRDEILELYNTTDLFMLPSLYEGIANVCLEAMSMEVPVVATKSGGMEEVIAPHVDGVLCNIYDAEDLANAVLSISADAAQRQQMGIAARQKVLSQFTIQRQANEFEEKYLSLITQQ